MIPGMLCSGARRSQGPLRIRRQRRPLAEGSRHRQNEALFRYVPSMLIRIDRHPPGARTQKSLDEAVDSKSHERDYYPRRRQPRPNESLYSVPRNREIFEFAPPLNDGGPRE